MNNPSDTIRVSRGIHEAGLRAMLERDAWDRWCMDLARTLNVPCDRFASNSVREQYAELRNRIICHVTNHPLPLADFITAYNATLQPANP